MKEERIKILRHEFSLKNPLIMVKEILGFGSHGVAFALPEDKALKLTIDPQEIHVSESLLGRHCNYLCNIESIGEFYSVSEERQYTWIIMERLYKSTEQEWINQSFRDFRHAWATLYPDKSGDSHFNWSNLWSIYKHGDISKINHCVKLCEDYLYRLNENEDTFVQVSDEYIQERINNVRIFFSFFEYAYAELFSICPIGRIDLNEGNFMFDKDNHLKVIDMQIEGNF